MLHSPSQRPRSAGEGLPAPLQPPPRTPGPGLVPTGIWYTALTSFALAPPMFVVLGALEIVQWWRHAGAPL